MGEQKTMIDADRAVRNDERANQMGERQQSFAERQAQMEGGE